MTTASNAQHNHRLDSLKKLGRGKLIQLAVKELNDPKFNPSHYDRITVKATKKSLIVEFALSVRLTTKSSWYYYAVWVALIGDGEGKSIIGNCDNPGYYSFSESDQRKVAFVFDAINKSDEIGPIPNNKLEPDTRMEIKEEPGHYFVEVSSYSTYSHYKVDALTGAISEAGHKHYDRRGENNDEFIVIDR